MRSELALLGHDVAAEAGSRERLSARETAELAALDNPRVRGRRLAGRLAAKHLLLRAQESPAAVVAQPAASPAGLVALDARRLDAFPAASYRAVELLSSVADGAPWATLHGRPLASRVSISHGAGVSCAAVAATGAAVGVDLEVVGPRVSAFYRRNFTARERMWVAAGARGSGLGAEWLYTLLWTVKEAALKSAATAVRSVWAFPQMEVALAAELPALLAAGRGAALGERFTGFDTTVAVGERCTRARVETTATDDTILSLFTAVEAMS